VGAEDLVHSARAVPTLLDAIGDGEKLDFPIDGVHTRVLDVSRRDSTLLLVTAKGEERQLWTKSPGAAPVRLGNITATYAVFSPDGNRVAFIQNGNSLWTSGTDGANARKVSDLPGPSSWPAWSPVGSACALPSGVCWKLGKRPSGKLPWTGGISTLFFLAGAIPRPNAADHGPRTGAITYSLRRTAEA